MNRKGLLLALIHVLLVSGLALNLYSDRAIFPHAWARVLPVDPNLPIRGRYVRLRLSVPYRGRDVGTVEVALRVDGRQVVAEPHEKGVLAFVKAGQAELAKPLAFFIPEHVPDPSRLPPGEELWADVTVLPRASPRPLRLAVKRGDRLEILTVE